MDWKNEIQKPEAAKYWLSAIVESGDEKPDVLISDIGMPVVVGYEFTRRVRALPAERVAKVQLSS